MQVRRRTVWNRFLHHGSAVAALVVLILIVLSAVLANVISRQDPTAQSLSSRLLPPFWLAKGSFAHPLGSDGFGRDILTRILYGGRISLLIGFVCSTTGAIIGIALGILAGYRGGKLGTVIMRISDVQLAFPFIVLAIAVIATLGSDIKVLLALLSLFGWVSFARITRAQTLRIRNGEFVEAARVVGAGSGRIMLRHVLPNVISSNLVIWTFNVAQLILVESTLSFLGLGVQPPTPSWGNMLSEGRTYVSDAWWLAIFPGLAITITVLAVNTLGDALRDVFDPRLQVR
ncbi:MAG: ABC transporter permease [Chloroflexi bacterium]|nr:ABC transporter permease [Chloroflexota bacterium]